MPSNASADNPLKSIKAKTAISSTSKLNKFSVENIDRLKDRNNDDIVFSFVPIDIDHEAFNLGGVCPEWYTSLFDALKEVSRMTWAQVCMSEHFQGHKHTWGKTNYRFEFDEDTLQQFDGVQFRLSKSKGRVHGFIIGNRFYVYWLDPHHNMSDSTGYGGVNYQSPVKTCFEKLSEENASLISEKSEIARIVRKNQRDNEDLLKYCEENDELIKALKDKVKVYEKQINDLQSSFDSKQKSKEKYNEKMKKRLAKGKK